MPKEHKISEIWSWLFEIIGQQFPLFHEISSLSQACSLYESMGDARNAAAAACRDAYKWTLWTVI